MFNTYTSSKYDIPIIVICFAAILFIFAIISAEIERRENKFKDAIIAVLLIVGLLGISALSLSVKSFEYLLNVLVILALIYILGKDIISFYL